MGKNQGKKQAKSRVEMAKIEDGELNRTMSKIMNYLFEELKDGAKYVPYRTISHAVGRSYGSVKYSIEKLRRMGDRKSVV